MVAVAIVVLVVAAFAPPVQTWIAQWVLSEQTGVEGSLGGFQAAFGEVAIHDLSLKSGGAVLTVPSLEAGLPLTTAALRRRVHLRRLVAKGWTLDLRGVAGPKNPDKTKPLPALGAPGGPPAIARAALASAVTLTRYLRANLSRWTLPCDLSMDGVDLEGDVLVANASSDQPSRLHVLIKGGGLAAGREGAFDIEITGSILGAEFAAAGLAAQGRLAVAMATPRVIRRIDLKAGLSAGAPYPSDLILSEEIIADAGAGEGAFSVSLTRDGRPLASVSAKVPDATALPAGTWKLDLPESDVAAVLADSELPTLAAKGEGTFDADANFTRVHALGRLGVTATQLGTLEPSLQGVAKLSIDTSLDATLTGPSIRVDHLSATLAGTAPIAEARLVQAFDIDANTGAFKPTDPAGDWVEISLRQLPLAWVPVSVNGITLSGGDVTGALALRVKQGGFTLRTTSPLAAGGVSVLRAGRTLGRNLDLSVSMTTDYDPKGWRIQLAPLAIASGGASVATFKGSLAQPGGDEPITLTGSWTADLQNLAAKAVIPDLDWVKGSSASGDLTGTLGSAMTWDAKLAYVGTNPDDTIAAELHAEFDGDRLLLRVPLKIALGSALSDVVVESTSFHDIGGNQFYLKLTGKKLNLEHLKLVAARLVAAGILPPPTAAGVRDKIPFWGDWGGRVTVMLEQLVAGKQAFNYVAAAFDVRNGTVRFSEGRGKLGERVLTNLAGSLAFDAAAEFPYRATATADLDKIEATELFPVPADGSDPAIEGRFAIAGSLTSDGINFDDLVSRARETLKISSIAGAVRFLKTNVNEAIPREGQSTAGDAFGRVGTALGHFLGAETDIGTGKRTVNPSIQQAIDVINAISEIAFDEVSLTAVRAPDETVRLGDIVLTAGDERLTGSGEIGHVAGRPLREQPLKVDLQFWAKDRIARLMTAAGLLSDRKDGKGYTALKEPIELRGTMAKIDTSQWHKMLVESAKRTPVAAPKSAPVGAKPATPKPAR